MPVEEPGVSPPPPSLVRRDPLLPVLAAVYTSPSFRSASLQCFFMHVLQRCTRNRLPSRRRRLHVCQDSSLQSVDWLFAVLLYLAVHDIFPKLLKDEIFLLVGKLTGVHVTAYSPYTVAP